MKHSKLPITLLFILFISSINAIACSCNDPNSIKDELKISDVVIKGKVISKVITSNLLPYGISTTGDTKSFMYKFFINSGIAVFKIKIEHIYKGKLSSDTVIILTSPNGGGCGFNFQLNNNYIIYGTTKDAVFQSLNFKRTSNNINTYWTNQCSRTCSWYAEEEKQIKAALKE